MHKYNTLYVKCVVLRNQVLRLVMHTHNKPTMSNALYIRDLAMPVNIAQVYAKAEEFAHLARCANVQLMDPTGVNAPKNVA